MSIYLLSRGEPTCTAVVSTLYGFDVQAAPGDGIAGDSFGTIVALNIPNLGGSRTTTAIGINIAAQSGATTNVGIRLVTGAQGGIWFNSDTADQTAGIVFGTARDTNLYRSAANVLATDDSFYAALHARIGSVAAPTNTTAGDLTISRLFVGNAAAVANVEALITGDAAVSGTLMVGASALCAAGHALEVRQVSPAANETELWLGEGTPETVRQVKWMDPGAGGGNFVGGEKVMVLV
jgi:hypothetical protein